jgi:hypothetical protein
MAPPVTEKQRGSVNLFPAGWSASQTFARGVVLAVAFSVTSCAGEVAGPIGLGIFNGALSAVPHGDAPK